jgi:hypothetical protein
MNPSAPQQIAGLFFFVQLEQRDFGRKRQESWRIAD